MKKNIGNADRIIRTLLAIVIAVLFFTKVLTGTFGIILLVVAGIFVITSVFSICPLYMPLGIVTTKKK